MNCEIDDDGAFYTPLFQKIGKFLESLFISFHKNNSKLLLGLLLQYCNNINFLHLTDISCSNTRDLLQLVYMTLQHLTINIRFDGKWY